jgi:membrane protease YdiL (CAAX protease family)
MSDASSNSSHPAREPNLGRPWVVILITLLVFFASQFFAALLVSIGLAVFRPSESIADLLDDSAVTQFFYVASAEALVLAMTFLAVKKWRKLPLRSIGFGRWPMRRDFTLAIGGAAAFYGLLIASSILITYLIPDLDIDAEQDVGFNTLNTALDQSLAFIALVVLPPIGEETLMRGYLYSGLRAYWRFIPAAIVTSLLFGVAHLGTGAAGVTLWIAGINTFLLSLVLVYLRERTGALYAPMLVHAANNLIAFSIHFR